MRSHIFLSLMLCASFALGACSENGQTAEQAETVGIPEDPITSYFQCGDKLIEFAAFDDGKGNMRIANVSYAMEQAISASGARYNNLGDDSTVFWNKGDRAWVTIDGTELPECEQVAKPKPIKPYNAVGNEPGWGVTIEGKRMTFTTDYGVTEHEAAVDDDTTTNNVRVVQGKDSEGASVTVTITPERCEDSMSGEKFAHQVTLDHGGKIYKGCGQSFRNVTWVLEDMNNAGIIDRSHLTAIFTQDGVVHGRSGCNSFSGRYTAEGENILINDNIVSTMMACLADSLMIQERKYLDTLTKVNKGTLDETGALVMTDGKGHSLKFRMSEDE